MNCGYRGLPCWQYKAFYRQGFRHAFLTWRLCPCRKHSRPGARPYCANSKTQPPPSMSHRYFLVLIHLNILRRYLGLKLGIPDDLLLIRNPLLPTLPHYRRHCQSVRTDIHVRQAAWLWHQTGVLAVLSTGLSVVRKAAQSPETVAMASAVRTDKSRTPDQQCSNWVMS